MSTLILSGWTQPPDALAHLTDDPVIFDYSDYPTPDAAIVALSKLNPNHTIAWSLGGQLALRAIGAGAIAPAHLTLIAAPAQFLSTPTLKGMDPVTYQLFRDSYASDPARTKTRFHGLIAKGDQRNREVMDLLGHHPHTEETSRWLPWLEHLAAHQLTPTTLASAPPTLIIHGMNDHIVPHTQGEHLARELSNAQLNSWEAVGHAPHLHDAARLRTEIATHRTAHGVV